MISARAKALVEALHEPFSNEKRWQIAEKHLDAAEKQGILIGERRAHLMNVSTPMGSGGTDYTAQDKDRLLGLIGLVDDKIEPTFVPLSEKIAQTRGQNGEGE
jgi:hypothetical protein